jgi:molecular chaperone DnaK (HSP70)
MSWLDRFHKWLSGTSREERHEQAELRALLARQNQVLASLSKEVKALRAEIKDLKVTRSSDVVQQNVKIPTDQQEQPAISKDDILIEPGAEVLLPLVIDVPAAVDQVSQVPEDQQQNPLIEEPRPVEPTAEATNTFAGPASLEEFGQLIMPDPQTRAEIPQLNPDQIIDELRPEEAPTVSIVTQTESEPTISLKPAPKDVYIGLDFGTSTTAVAIRIGDELPKAIPIGKDGVTPYIPSVVYIAPGSGDLLSRSVVGDEADQAENEDPFRTIRSVKRCLGCNGNKCRESDMELRVILPTRKSPEPPAWCQSNGKIHLGGFEVVKPEEVAALIIRQALFLATQHLQAHRGIDLTLENVSVFPLNMGCGAKFDFRTRTLLARILQDLGFKQFKIENVIEEPILAGFAFSRYAENQEGRVLIYDFGGGTFDVALLNIDRITEQEQTGDLGNAGERRVSVIATAGQQWLGGDDIDTLVFEFFADQLAKRNGVEKEVFLKRLAALDLRKLRKQAKAAKEYLSSHTDYQGDFYSEALELLSITITRPEFEQLLPQSRLIEKSLEELKRALRLAECFKMAKESDLVDYPAILKMGLKELASSVDRLVLVGGITKIPIIRQELEQFFGQKIVSDLPYDPVEAVVIGACFPKMVQNFNVVAPPYGYYLEYVNPDTNRIEQLTLTEPFEYLGFHDQWTGSALPEFVKLFKVYPDFLHTNLFSIMAGSEESKTQVISLGTLPCNDWWFSISLSGMLYLQQPNAMPRFLGQTRQLHPLQSEIIAGQKLREQQRRDEQARRGNDQLITIFTDN